MKASLQYTRNKNKLVSSGRINTFFPSFVGLALRGNDLFVCEATKRFSTKLRSLTVKDFLSQDPSALRANPLAVNGRGKPIVLSWPRERTMVRELYVSNPNLQELRETLALQLDSLFPIGPEEAYFDLYPCISLKGTEESVSGRKVYLFAVDKRELEEVLDRLEVVGLVPSRIIPSSLAFLPMLEKRAEKVVCLYRNEEGGYIYNFYCTGGLVRTYVCEGEEELERSLQQNSPGAILAVGFKGEKLSRQILNTVVEETPITYLDPSWESSGASLYETYGHIYDFNLRRPNRRVVNYQNLYMVSLVALFFSLLFAIPQIAQIKNKERLNLIELEIEGIKKQAFALKGLEGIARTQKAVGTVLESQKGYVPRADILLGLSTLLPEDAWIKELSIKEDIFEVEGVTTSLAETMFLLEDSPIFSNVELIPPVVKDKDGKDCFRLKGNILQEEVHERS